MDKIYWSHNNLNSRNGNEIQILIRARHFDSFVQLSFFTGNDWMTGMFKKEHVKTACDAWCVGFFGHECPEKDSPWDSTTRSEPNGEVKPGSDWKHFKGCVYRVIRKDEDGIWYVKNGDQLVFLQPESRWHELVVSNDGSMVPRFSPL